MAQAAKVRPDLARFTGAVELAELAAGHGLLELAVAQAPDTGGPWAATGQPEASGPHTAWCNVTGAPPSGPVAGFVVDAWTETIPATQSHVGDRRALRPPVGVRAERRTARRRPPGQTFGLDLVRRCVGDTLAAMQYRALPADAERAALGQFLPAVFLPGDAVVAGRGAAGMTTWLRARGRQPRPGPGRGPGGARSPTRCGRWRANGRSASSPARTRPAP